MKIIWFLKSLLRSINISFFVYGFISFSSYMAHVIRIEKYTPVSSISLIQEQIVNKNLKNITLDASDYCFTLKKNISLIDNHGVYSDINKLRIRLDNSTLQKEIDLFAMSHSDIIDFNRLTFHFPTVYEILLILTLWSSIAGYISRDIEEYEQIEKKKQGRINVTFDDIIGLKETKREIDELLSLYSDSAISALKMKKPKGVLFFGAPGNGKTMMAKAIANEFGGSFFYVSASELMEIYVGVGPKKVRDIFHAAREAGNSVIFIDELDSIAVDRQGRSNEEAKNTFNQLLVEMDGIETSLNVLVIGATNIPNIFDEALKRRFEIQIDFANPNQDEIIELLTYLLKDIPTQNINVKYIASGLGDVSRANVVSIVENAKRIACANNRFYLISDDLDESALRHDMGRVNTNIKMPSEERWKTAYHEAGHAFMFYYYYKKNIFLHPPRYLTIIPRAHALGFVAPPSSDDYQSMTITFINSYMQVCYAGLVAEEIFCLDSGPSVGCCGDLMSARAYAENYVNFGLDVNVGYVGILRNECRTSDFELNSKFERIKILCEQNLNATREIMRENRVIIETIARAAIHFGYLTQEVLIDIIEGKIGDLSYGLVPIKKHEFIFSFDD